MMTLSTASARAASVPGLSLTTCSAREPIQVMRGSMEMSFVPLFIKSMMT